MENFNEEYTSDKPHSYGGKYRAYEYYTNNDKNKIDDAFKTSDIYSRFKQHKKAKTYSPIYVRSKRELFQCDTTFFTADRLVEANNGFAYLLCIIDVFSKMAWVYPMKNVNCRATVSCLKDVFRKCGKIPEKIQTDKGSEFKCTEFKKLMSDNHINHFFSTSDRKCAVVERFNLTIQQLIYKLMSHHNSYSWTTLLPIAMNIYLNKKHRTIKMSPLDAEKEMNKETLEKIYSEKYSVASSNRKTPKFNIGDTVRVWIKRTKFHRGYYENFTKEYFIISNVLTNLPVPRYKLKDILEEVIEGTFFEDELVSYIPKDDVYAIEKVIKTKGNGKNKKHLVKWDGWPSKFNSWISDQEIKNIKQT